MDQLKNGVFGKFLELNEVGHSGKLTHCMLLSQVFYKDKSKMVFKVFGNDVAFTEDDFHNITGYRVNRLKEWYFSDVKKGLKVDNLYKFMQKRSRLRAGAADDVCVDVEVCDEDALKLAEIYLLEAVLLDKDHSRNISDRSMKIIDDAELCASFPWGSFCFDELIYNLSHLLTSESVKKKPIGRIASYMALGFPFLFNRVSAKVEDIIRADHVNFKIKMKKNMKAIRKKMKKHVKTSVKVINDKLDIVVDIQNVK
ncbi:PREDICTED: uncharacterized protein LOC109237275 [Nicotiana attenuata]|uniref:uncharacterized protein LOC109237275 n=1 Tax=Nicotiana attenuata TaxID=49451 RepID=UPI0009059DE7|nr:PREDICTED: uncharacterized protein LOC109237275 [Nicotiana attenuata]